MLNNRKQTTWKIPIAYYYKTTIWEIIKVYLHYIYKSIEYLLRIMLELLESAELD